MKGNGPWVRRATGKRANEKAERHDTTRREKLGMGERLAVQRQSRAGQRERAVNANGTASSAKQTGLDAGRRGGKEW